MILRFIQKYNVYIHVNLMPVYHWCVYVTDMFMLTWCQYIIGVQMWLRTSCLSVISVFITCLLESRMVLPLDWVLSSKHPFFTRETYDNRDFYTLLKFTLVKEEAPLYEWIFIISPYWHIYTFKENISLIKWDNILIILDTPL